jgi:hypothetical protein
MICKTFIYLTILFWILSYNRNHNHNHNHKNKQMTKKIIFYIGDTPIPPSRNISTPYRNKTNSTKENVDVGITFPATRITISRSYPYQWPLYYSMMLKWF